MEILERGEPDKEYKVLCHKCKSILLVKRSDAESYKVFSRLLIFICLVCNVRFKLDGVYK